MELALYGILFLGCAALLYVSGEWIVGGLTRLSRLFGIREFVLAFFVMAVAASTPNLLVGITSAMQGIPELSLGDVFGNNIIAMTLAVAAGVFFSKNRSIEAQGKTIRISLLFTVAAAVLPILLLLNGNLDRIDGLILIGFFFIYVIWLLSQRSKFSKPYGPEFNPNESVLEKGRRSFTDVFKVLGGVGLLVLAAFGIVSSASYFAAHFGIPLILIGLLTVGLGNALPEVYFSIASARRNETELIMGNLMGSVIVPATLVLGIVSLVHPIHFENFEFLAEGRAFLLISAALFFLFSKTHQRIGRIEALILLSVYIAFVVWAIFTSS